ncbi:MAG: aldo/keto reductase [Clostridiales bacterium]|nr:aldo/keto reductase [Clostridiales bacterium]
MELRKMEKLNVMTSLLGFGCMRFPLRDGKIDEEIAEKMMLEAYHCGVNYFDTAYPYHDGKSEAFTGRVLDQLPRESYFLATKLPCWLVNETSDVEALFSEQLSRLNKEFVDFYLLHALDAKSWDKMCSLGVVEECERLVKEGKIRYLGFSFHDSYEVFERILQYRDWDFCQIQLNYMDTDTQAGSKGYKLAESLDIPVIVMEPVKGGSLARLPDDIYAVMSEVTPDASPASWALRWAGGLPHVKVVLSGMSTMEQVRENCDIFKDFEPLSDKESVAIRKAAELFRSRIRNECTTCGYCMPCPFGVNIPENFKIWNEFAMFENDGHTRWAWNNMADDSKAHNCTECGQCEAVCPQGLSIIEDLKTLQAELDEFAKK